MAEKLLRYEDELADEVKSLAKKQRKSENQVIQDAIQFYCAYCNSKEKANFLNDQNKLMMAQLETKINKKTNEVLSELAIQCAVQNMILGNSLDISMADFHEYQEKAKSFLKQKNRPLRLDDILW